MNKPVYVITRSENYVSCMEYIDTYSDLSDAEDKAEELNSDCTRDIKYTVNTIYPK